jgi:hypothetical protein
MPRTIFFEKELMPIAMKVTKIVSSVPKIDGHFWVERDGVKIDPHFEYYDKVKLANRGKKFIYYPADEITQNFMIILHLKVISREYATLGEFLDDYKEIAGEKPVTGFCIFNALIEKEKNGGELIFGSWGVEREDGSKFYDFGGEDYKGVSAFMKTRT